MELGVREADYLSGSQFTEPARSCVAFQKSRGRRILAATEVARTVPKLPARYLRSLVEVAGNVRLELAAIFRP